MLHPEVGNSRGKYNDSSLELSPKFIATFKLVPFEIVTFSVTESLAAMYNSLLHSFSWALGDLVRHIASPGPFAGVSTYTVVLIVLLSTRLLALMTTRYFPGSV